MICLSKADEGAFRHLLFNQSPGPLAAHQTTCEDLNGISNLREHVNACQDGGGGGASGGIFSALDEKDLLHSQQPPGTEPPVANAGKWSSGSSSRPETESGGDDRNRLSSTRLACLGRARSWVFLVLSILPIAFMLFAVSSYLKIVPSRVEGPLVSASKPAPSRKRSSCVSGGVSDAKYNTPLHVGALLIILFVSTTACAFPLFAVKFPALRIPGRFFFAVRHFGTGVLIATAFVHLLPTAFLSLGNPCLSGFWVKDYPAMPGAIALAGIFLVTVIEMIFHPSRQITPVQVVSKYPHNSRPFDNRTEENVARVRDLGPLNGRTSSIGHQLTHLTRQQSCSGRVESSPGDGNEVVRTKSDLDCRPAGDQERFADDSQEPELTPEQKQRKELLQCILLEVGILFHSVFIGMSLSVSVGNEFIVLLIAIAFHQTFEGLALGARIAAVNWPKQQSQPWLMALAYGCTTPLGQAIGLATHTLYNPGSEVGLILVGVMNAISAGLLTFASLVELLSEDFLSDASWRYLRGRRRVYACLLVFFGAFFMSLVGAWA